jgi:glycine cleavage system aminomethyltransferase T
MASALSALHGDHAVSVMRGGSPVIAHYGSVATEVALCVKRAGIVERPELCVLELAGQAPFLEHVLDRALGELAPAPGRAAGVGGTWCARPTSSRALVAVPAAGAARWRELARRSMLAGTRLTCRELPGMAVVSLVGPRAAGVLKAAGLPGDLPAGGAAAALLGTTPAVVVRERADGFLVFAEAAPGRDPWDALCEAGRPLGLAPVGHDALDRLTAALHAAPAARTLL